MVQKFKFNKKSLEIRGFLDCINYVSQWLIITDIVTSHTGV
ncbi:hypothetical protein MGSAQ_001989 [marine sediment metagenome]|uniref:Uncharacterized protein n=1 Tax=marine sediment metagenome TaxID=412755 RepID=A0A1B6NST1_9ZZZZ